jgi:hypothetical protein
LTVRVDGETWIDRHLTHRGVRHTRPLAVDEALEVPPGSRRVEIAFVPVLPGGLEVDATDPERAAKLRAAFAALPVPRLDQRVDFLAGRAALVFLGPDQELRWSAPTGR